MVADVDDNEFVAAVAGVLLGMVTVLMSVSRSSSNETDLVCLFIVDDALVKSFLAVAVAVDVVAGVGRPVIPSMGRGLLGVVGSSALIGLVVAAPAAAVEVILMRFADPGSSANIASCLSSSESSASNESRSMS